MDWVEQLEERGRLEGHRDVVRGLLALKFGPLDQDVAARLDAASAEDLDRYLARVLDADSVADVVAE